jgi:predicted nucleotidyltransferase
MMDSQGTISEQLVLERFRKLSPDSQKEVLDLITDRCRRDVSRPDGPVYGVADLLLPKREEILCIAAAHGAFNVRVFGSVARGEADQYSDVDFLIEFDSEKASPWFPVGLMHDLEDLLGRKVDVVTEGSLKGLTRDQILQEAVAL